MAAFAWRKIRPTFLGFTERIMSCGVMGKEVEEGRSKTRIEAAVAF